MEFNNNASGRNVAKMRSLHHRPILRGRALLFRICSLSKHKGAMPPEISQTHGPSPPIQKFAPAKMNFASGFISKRKAWIRLNLSYLPGTAAATAAAFIVANIAESLGASREAATTYVAGISAFIAGVSAIALSWATWMRKALPCDKHERRAHMAKFITGTFLAQACTWPVSWSASYIAVYLGAANATAVLVQQIVDRAVFIPLYNIFNKNRVKEVEQMPPSASNVA